jgi:fructose-1,6-bisphosphatase
LNDLLNLKNNTMIISEKITGNEEIISEKDLINSVNSAKLAKFKEINQAKKQAKFVQSNTKIEKSDTQKLIERLVNDAVKNFLKKSETIETIDNIMPLEMK